MRTFIVLTALLLPPFAASAGPKEDLLQNQRTKRSAINLFQTDAAGVAVSYLRQNLRPENGPAGDVTGLVQTLIEIAGEFYNRRDMKRARETSVQAVSAAEPILSGQTQASALRRADLYASLGILHEIVMFDLRTAQTYYDAAILLNPADELSKRRKSAMVEKQQRLAGGGR
jgi:hypothetical protein